VEFGEVGFVAVRSIPSRHKSGLVFLIARFLFTPIDRSHHEVIVKQTGSILVILGVLFLHYHQEVLLRTEQTNFFI